MIRGQMERLTINRGLTWGGREAEIVPAPGGHDGIRLEGLQARDVCAKGKVAIADLQRGGLRALLPADVERLDDLLALGDGYRLRKGAQREEEGQGTHCGY